MGSKFDEIKTNILGKYPHIKSLGFIGKLRAKFSGTECERTDTFREPCDSTKNIQNLPPEVVEKLHNVYSQTYVTVTYNGVEYFLRWGGLR